MLNMLSYLGGMGAGLVWGWLVILVLGRGVSCRPLAGYLGVAAATLLLCLQYLFQADWMAAAFFWGATVCSTVLHLGWLRFRRRSL
jgi:hypothetical protein